MTSAFNLFSFRVYLHTVIVMWILHTVHFNKHPRYCARFGMHRTSIVYNSDKLINIFRIRVSPQPQDEQYYEAIVIIIIYIIYCMRVK